MPARPKVYCGSPSNGGEHARSEAIQWRAQVDATSESNAVQVVADPATMTCTLPLPPAMTCEMGPRSTRSLLQHKIRNLEIALEITFKNGACVQTAMCMIHCFDDGGMM